MKKKLISNKEFLKLAKKASKPVRFKSKKEIDILNRKLKELRNDKKNN